MVKDFTIWTFLNGRRYQAIDMIVFKKSSCNTNAEADFFPSVRIMALEKVHNMDLSSGD
ncbi:hypothetical protein [Rhizobium sp.]